MQISKIIKLWFPACILIIYSPPGKTAYSVESDETSIQKEIQSNGPVEGTLAVFEDLLSYKEGKCC